MRLPLLLLLLWIAMRTTLDHDACAGCGITMHDAKPR